MAPPLHERFIQECEKREMTPSDFIRRLVDAALEQIDTPTSYLTRMPGESVRVAEEIQRIATKRGFPTPVKQRGFAWDGSGDEITPAQQHMNRQAAIEKKRK